MNNKTDQLLRELEEIKSLEDKAHDLYQSLLSQVEDATDQKNLERVASDEIKHSKIVQTIINIVKA